MRQPVTLMHDEGLYRLPCEHAFTSVEKHQAQEHARNCASVLFNLIPPECWPQHVFDEHAAWTKVTTPAIMSPSPVASQESMRSARAPSSQPAASSQEEQIEQERAEEQHASFEEYEEDTDDADPIAAQLEALSKAELADELLAERVDQGADSTTLAADAETNNDLTFATETVEANEADAKAAQGEAVEVEPDISTSERRPSVPVQSASLEGEFRSNYLEQCVQDADSGIAPPTEPYILKAHFLGWDLVHKLLVCNICHHAILASSLREHFKKVQGHSMSL